MSQAVQRKENRLAREKSPYLLQHRNNPVDWYPWGEEAFEKAKKEDKPVFLSVGYSTCHWCHVMERESFEDEETAEVLNKNFISIKLDREERPDIDNIYMTFCQIYTGSGGWPLSIFMTPDKKPFFAGTYFPKESRYGMPGFISLLNSITELWKEDREKISDTGEEIIEILSRVEKRESKEIDEEKFIENAVTMLHNTFDFKYGGFGNRPKFPSPHTLMFLLRYWKSHEGNNVLTMVEETLKSMYKGGIFDHIGFGFSRYSTDEKWLVPHFEKMLYDNAMLAYIYCETYNATGNELYKEIAEEIFEYVLRDMTSKGGGFYSAEDADSEGVEGKFYVFTPEEIKDILGEKDGEFILEKLVKDDGRLLGRYREGEAANLGILQDYAYLIWGLIEIYLTAFDVKYLEKAIELNNQMIELFWDKEHDGLFLYGSDGEKLIIRPKELYDGAIPSGSSAAAHNMIMLSRITGDYQYEERANKLLKTFTQEVEKSHTSYLYYGACLLLKLNPGTQVVVCGDKNEHETQEMLKEAYKNYDPYKVVLLKDEESEKDNIKEICPILKDKEKVNNKVTAYVCKNYTCKAPVITYKELNKLL